MITKKNSAIDFLTSHLSRKYILLVILAIACCVRLFRLGSVPASLYWEEVALGYDAYSIARTGKDHHGNSYPLVAFPSFGDYKPSGYFYAVVPFVATLGPNEWAVRLPSALAGIAAVFVVYAVTKELLDERTALTASVVLAIQPWHIQFSRGGWEVNFALFLLLIGTWLLIRARQKPYVLIGSVFFYAASMYTYHAARLFAPLVAAFGGVVLLYLWYRDAGKNIWRISRTQWSFVGVSIFFGVLIVFPLLSNLRSEAVSSRFSQTSIFSDLDPILRSNGAKERCGDTGLCKLLHHRYRYFGQVALQQWSAHFSAQFLFVRGDGNLRHGTGVSGLLYPIESAFILISLFVFLSKGAKSYLRSRPIEKRSKILFLAFIWIALAAVAPALVTPAPHALRFLFAAPAFAVLTAVGIDFILHSTKKYRIIIAFVCIGSYLFCTTRYLSWYYTGYAVQSAADWQYGYKELYDGLAQYKKEGEQVYISRTQGRPAMYYLFYSAYDPALLQKLEPDIPKDQLELLQVEDYHFVDGVPNGPGLFATGLDQQDPNSEFIGYIRRPDWSVVWSVWRRE